MLPEFVEFVEFDSLLVSFIVRFFVAIVVGIELILAKFCTYKKLRVLRIYWTNKIIFINGTGDNKYTAILTIFDAFGSSLYII